MPTTSFDLLVAEVVVCCCIERALIEHGSGVEFNALSICEAGLLCDCVPNFETFSRATN